MVIIQSHYSVNSYNSDEVRNLVSQIIHSLGLVVTRTALF